MITLPLAVTSVGVNWPVIVIYPVSYVGALTDHFCDPLSPSDGYPRSDWHNYARLAHCGSVLFEFRDLAGFEKAASRDHVVILYGDHQRDFEILAVVLGLEAKIF